MATTALTTDERTLALQRLRSALVLLGMQRSIEELGKAVVTVAEGLIEAFGPAVKRFAEGVLNLDPAAKVFPVEGELLPLDPRRLTS